VVHWSYTQQTLHPGRKSGSRKVPQLLIPLTVPFLQDHDVPEDKIFLLSLLMAEMGVHSVAYAFPRVKIITTAVDKKVNDLFRIIPGIGEYLRRNVWCFWPAQQLN